MTNSKCGNELLSVNYTLQPLIDEVADPLVCFSEDKIKKVTPTEIHVSFYNSNNSHIIIQGNNAFETLHKINLHPAKKNIGFARFKVLTADGQEHTLILEPPGGIFYDGELDIIHQWLSQRGFVINESLAAKKTFPLIPSGIFLSVATTVPL